MPVRWQRRATPAVVPTPHRLGGTDQVSCAATETSETGRHSYAVQSFRSSESTILFSRRSSGPRRGLRFHRVTASRQASMSDQKSTSSTWPDTSCTKTQASQTLSMREVLENPWILAETEASPRFAIWEATKPDKDGNCRTVNQDARRQSDKKQSNTWEVERL